MKRYAIAAVLVMAGFVLSACSPQTQRAPADSSAREPAMSDQEIDQGSQDAIASIQTPTESERQAEMAKLVEACKAVEPTSECETRAAKLVGDEAVASKAHTVRVSIDELTTWWPFRPILRWTNQLGQNDAETVFAFSDEGGTQGSASDEFSSVAMFWHPASASPLKYSRAVVQERGGAELFILRGTRGSRYPELQQQPTRPVIVRGQPGRIKIYTTDDRHGEGTANVNLRQVQWTQDIEGSTLFWSFDNDPRLYTDEETLRIINNLSEIN